MEGERRKDDKKQRKVWDFRLFYVLLQTVSKIFIINSIIIMKISKRIRMTLAVVIMAVASVNAQNGYMNELSVAYGFGSNTDLASSFYKGVFTGKQLNYWGPISLEYFHRLTNNNRLGLGAVFVLGGCKWDDSSDAKSTYITIMPAFKYNWSVRKIVSWYSKAAIGLTFHSESGLTKSTSKNDDASTTFNFQATFVGVEVGGALRGFAELGIGEQGIILAGIRYKF